VAGTHQFAVAKRRGRWKWFETPQLTQAKAEIARLNPISSSACSSGRPRWRRRSRTKSGRRGSPGGAEALAHVTRLTTISELTASLAHEVNQPLAAIVNNATASLNWLAHTPPPSTGPRTEWSS